MIRITARKYKSDFHTALALARASGSEDSGKDNSTLAEPMPNANCFFLSSTPPEMIPVSLPLTSDQRDIYNRHSNATTAAVVTSSTLEHAATTFATSVADNVACATPTEIVTINSSSSQANNGKRKSYKQREQQSTRHLVTPAHDKKRRMTLHDYAIIKDTSCIVSSTESLLAIESKAVAAESNDASKIPIPPAPLRAFEYVSTVVTDNNYDVSTATAASDYLTDNPTVVVSSSNEAQHPMLARPIKTFAQLERVFDASLHVVETKYDGERLLYDTRTRVSYTRTLKTPPLVPVRFEICLHPPHIHALLDGERVFLSSSSSSSLSSNRKDDYDSIDVSTTEVPTLALCDTKRRATLRQCYVIFDIQALDGHSVTHEPLSVRRRLLERCVDVSASRNARLSDWRTFCSASELRRFFDKHVTQGMHEGLMVKRLDEPYMSNRREWWKLKPLHLRDHRCEVDLVAYAAVRDKNGSLSVLCCGYYPDSVTVAADSTNNGKADQLDGLVHVCRVSSGLRKADLARLNILCDPSSPMGKFYQPVVVVLTADKVTAARNSLRHPIFLRFDTTKEPRDVRSIRFE